MTRIDSGLRVIGIRRIKDVDFQVVSVQSFFRYAFAILGLCFMACYHDSIDEIGEASSESLPVTGEATLYKDSIIVMQWNIGHFSRGKSPYSLILDTGFTQMLEDYRQLLNDVSADVVSLCEYSIFFINTALHPRCYADTALFYDYPYKFIGNNGIIRNYSLNAIMSKREIIQPSSIEYTANATARITHSSAIKATDYYYNQSYINIGGREVVFINTHLAFDKNNPSVATSQIIELIGKLEEETYVIICGDFNTMASSYSLFSKAGYSLANAGDLGTYPSAQTSAPLDNIISKGLLIRDVYTINSSLSDHYPIVCTVSVDD